VGWQAEDVDDTLHRDAEVTHIRGHGGRKPSRIYHLPPLNSIVLERGQVERFHIVARPYEIKTENKEV
jgi:hypothetical protein